MRTKTFSKGEIRKVLAKNIAEQATGIEERGKLQFWSSKGERIERKEAKRRIEEGEMIEVPSAGAGSYDEIFQDLGFEEIRDIFLSSSAGDWTFGVKDKRGWRVAGQENRYPYYGFKYWIGKESFKDFETLLDFMGR